MSYIYNYSDLTKLKWRLEKIMGGMTIHQQKQLVELLTFVDKVAAEEAAEIYKEKKIIFDFNFGVNGLNEYPVHI